MARRAPDGSAEDCGAGGRIRGRVARARRRGHQRRAQRAGDAQGHGGDGLSPGTAAVGLPRSDASIMKRWPDVAIVCVVFVVVFNKKREFSSFLFLCVCVIMMYSHSKIMTLFYYYSLSCHVQNTSVYRETHKWCRFRYFYVCMFTSHWIWFLSLLYTFYLVYRYPAR